MAIQVNQLRFKHLLCSRLSAGHMELCLQGGFRSVWEKDMRHVSALQGTAQQGSPQSRLGVSTVGDRASILQGTFRGTALNLSAHSVASSTGISRELVRNAPSRAPSQPC